MGAADGLLERKALCLSRRCAAGRRAILDLDTASTVGFCQSRPRVGWWARLARRVDAVHEQQDESLLCTVRRSCSLFSWYEVWDADDRRVGWHGGPLLMDGAGHRVAVRENETATGTTLYRSPDRKVLARLTATCDDVRLTFADEIAGEPFVKMLLLAAALRC